MTTANFYLGRLALLAGCDNTCQLAAEPQYELLLYPAQAIVRSIAFAETCRAMAAIGGGIFGSSVDAIALSVAVIDLWRGYLW